MIMKSNTSGPKKVILVELNEITWRIVDKLIARGKLPTFAQFARDGVKGTPMATEVAPDLDPWISWTSLYTGRPQEEPGVRFLEQPPETVTGPRIWDMAVDGGKSVGVYGSIMSWPPRRDVKGFWVPGTFSPGPETYPDDLRPIQDLNLSHTRAHNPVAKLEKKEGLVSQALKLRKLGGLKLGSVKTVVSFLLRTRINKHRKWEKVSLQPLINLDFYEALYKKYRPEFSTFHSNHVAHYMHRYWRAMDPDAFRLKPTPEEIKKFGGAIEFGYDVCDQLLRRVWNLADENTVVIVASGLGQQPYVVDKFEGRVMVRVKNIDHVLDLLGVKGRCTPSAVMAPQWNLGFTDPAALAQAQKLLSSAYAGTPERKLFAFDTVGNMINFNLSQKNLHPVDPEMEVVFPDAGGQRFKLKDIAAMEDETPKEGYHDQAGVLLMRGAGIKKGAVVKDCTNLDLAPTMLHLMGLPIPSYMKGRVLGEALEDGGVGEVRVPAERQVERREPVGV